MKIKSANFLISNSDYKKCPAGDTPEFAFIGRSNVGKSSLINKLVERKALAKISGKPGKTQLINHFLINDNWYLVDLPGYGYAKSSKKNRKIWKDFIRDYILNRSNLMCLFILIDSRHEPLKNDSEFMEQIGINGIPFVIIFTKSDKIKIKKSEDNIQAYKKHMLKTWESMPEYIISSAITKTGQEDILNFIEQTNKLF